MSDNGRNFPGARCVHLITFWVFRRRRLLDLDQPKWIVLGVLNHLLKAMSGRCVGCVLMPHHVPALSWLPELKELKRFLPGWKRMSSFRIRPWYAQQAPNDFAQFGPGDKFRQAKSYVFHASSEHTIREKLDYLPMNPVRAGLVERADPWRWSSARRYLHRRSVGVPIHWIE